MTPEQQEIILTLGRDRQLAHATLFRHRHPDPTPPFHHEMIKLWHSQTPKISIMAFRNAAKSTCAEEALIIGACYQLFHNAVIVGSTEARAIERLRAVKHELDTNEFLRQTFGDLGIVTARVWNEAEVILANGVRMFAMGKGQNVRGTKHLQWRPDFCFCDDIEEVEPGQVYSEEDAEKTIDWFQSVLLEALDKDARVRVTGTPLARNALPIKLSNLSSWVTRTYPIEHFTPTGERKATWEARYSLPWIDDKKDEYEKLGIHHRFMQEFMCVVEDPSKKVFTPDLFVVTPHVRTWQPTWAFYDPARTVKATSATTGWAVWSWVGDRMIVWDAGAEFWQPDQLIKHIFDLDRDYAPVAIGIEQDGLHEFLMQPLRAEMLRRGYLIPLTPEKAPKGKIGFIEGLQPLLRGKQITFAKHLPTLFAQFLNFPSGKIDAPNALAYAPRMRPGQVVYEGFGPQHVVEGEINVLDRVPCWLCLNASGGVVSGTLVQFALGVLNVLQDYVREGDPGAVLGGLVQQAVLDAGAPPRLCAGPNHFGDYDRIGLRGAVARLPATLHRGQNPDVGRDELRRLLSTSVRGSPCLQVSSRSRWTLNALSAGYAREIGKDGKAVDEPREGIYRTLMEGLEAFTGLLQIGIMEERGQLNVQRTPAGQTYISALPGQATVSDAKASFPSAGAVSDLPSFRSARR